MISRYVFREVLDSQSPVRLERKSLMNPLPYVSWSLSEYQFASTVASSITTKKSVLFLIRLLREKLLKRLVYVRRISLTLRAMISISIPHLTRNLRSGRETNSLFQSHEKRFSRDMSCNHFERWVGTPPLSNKRYAIVLRPKGHSSKRPYW